MCAKCLRVCVCKTSFCFSRALASECAHTSPRIHPLDCASPDFIAYYMTFHQTLHLFDRRQCLESATTTHNRKPPDQKTVQTT